MNYRMTARLFGAGILALGLLASPAAAEAGNGRAALRHLPKDTAMVMTVNFDRARKSPLFKDAMKMAKQNPDVSKGMDLLKAKAAFDISRDLKTLTIGFDKDYQKTEKVTVLVQGKFNRKKFVSFAKASAQKVSKRKHRGVSYWLINDENELALLRGHMVMTQKGDMKDIIDVAKGKAANVKRNRAFMKMFRGADTSKDMWFIGVVPKDLKTQLKSNFGGNTVDQFAASIDVRKGLGADVRLEASSAAGAQAMAALMQAGLMQVKGDPSIKALGLGSAMNSIKIKAKASHVDVGLQLSPAELTKIKNMLKNFM